MDEQDNVDVSSTDMETDKDVFPVPTFKEAKKQRSELIKELREGGRGDQLLADAIAKCRHGARCDSIECPVCERRRLNAKNKVPWPIVKQLGSLAHPMMQIDVHAIKIVGRQRRLNEKKLKALTASIREIGLQTPISVWSRKKDVVLVTGRHRLEAVKRLKWDQIPCLVLVKDDINVDLWQLMENFCRADLTALERSEHLEGMRTLIQKKTKGGQVAPPGGKQPLNLGIKAAARLLGVSKEQIRRAMRISGIDSKVKDRLRELCLDRNQRALLEVAEQPTSNEQARIVEEIVERKRTGVGQRRAALSKNGARKIAGVQAEIDNDEAAVRAAKAKLAGDRKRLEVMRDRMAVHGTSTVETPAAPTEASSLTPDPETEARIKSMLVAFERSKKLELKFARASVEVREGFLSALRSWPRAGGTQNS